MEAVRQANLWSCACVTGVEALGMETNLPNCKAPHLFLLASAAPAQQASLNYSMGPICIKQKRKFRPCL